MLNQKKFWSWLACALGSGLAIILGIIIFSPSSKADSCVCVSTENGAFLYSGKCVSDNLPRGTIFRTTTTLCSSENITITQENYNAYMLTPNSYKAAMYNSGMCLKPNLTWDICSDKKEMYKELSKLPVKEVLEGLADGYLSNTKSAEALDKYIKELQRSHDLWTKNTFSLSSGSAGITSYSYCNVKGDCGPVPTDVIRDDK